MDNKKQEKQENNDAVEVKINEDKRVAPAALISQSPTVFFADSTIVTSSKYDTKIYFGFTLPKGEGGVTQYDTIITMSPQLARALAQSLEKSIKDYEDEFMSLKMKGE